MTRPRRPAARALLSAALGVAGLTAASAMEPPCVVELFTSQGCSSCPPADRLAAKLATEPGVIMLSFPVDYWDYIGWKDTLASPANTARQKAYASARGDGQVYTPQAVIDGLRHAVGSDQVEIGDAAKLAFGDKGALAVPLTIKRGDGRLVVDVGAAPAGAARSGAVWLFHIAKSRTVKISRGENAGHTLTYTNVVRSIDKVGDWMGEATHFEISDASLNAPDADSYALILQASQDGKPGAILAAAKGDGL